MNKVLLVNKKGEALGFFDKNLAHTLKGALHLAFSIFIINNKGEMLIQKRSKYKKLWPLYWSNACCSHPLKKNNIIGQAQKRLKEEFGFITSLKFIYKFYYQAQYKNIGSENELCYVLLGKHDGFLKPNKKEIDSFKWVTVAWLKKELYQHPEFYTPWFRLEFKRLIKRKEVKKWLKD